MSLIAEVAQVAGTSTADVIRVATHGGTTADDWAIAHAVQAVTGRSAYDLMLTAGREAEVARIWADSGTPAEAPAPTNSEATHDPQVLIYDEDTSPDAAPTVLPDRPHAEPDPEPQAPREQVGTWIVSVYSAVIDYVRSRVLAAHLLRKASAAGTVTAARQTLYTLLATHPRTNLFGLHPDPVELAV